MEIFPEPIISLWNKLELRVLVLLSLLWQVILIILGSRRKYIKGAVISFLVWVTYLSADWLATVSLGNLASGQEDVDISKSKTEGKDQVIKALWAPFLLLHLGGPDTITAYALEDNNLWLRHLLGLLVQVTVAFYIFLWTWGNNALTFVAIPVFVSGIIKYSERTWVLRATSPDQFEGSSHSASLVADLEYDDVGPELTCIRKGYSLFPLLKALYADLRPPFEEGQRSYSLMVKQGPTTKEGAIYAFQLVEVQLGFLFDVLYTKAIVIYSRNGIILRLISFLSIVSAFVGFIVAIDNTYSRVDVVITYTLFTGAVSLEIYAFVSLILSDWTRNWLTMSKSSFRRFVYRSFSCCRSILSHEKRWSGYMAQHNLVDFCLKETTLIRNNLFGKIYFELNMFRHRGWKEVDSDLKFIIFDELQKKYKAYEDTRFGGKFRRDLLSCKGDGLMEKYEGLIGSRWSFEVEFDHSILLWHVATDICYHSDLGDHDKRRLSKMLSDYLFYILLMQPLMLPKWSDRITYVKDTFNQAIRLFHRRKFPVKNSSDACKMLIQLCAQFQAVEFFEKKRVASLCYSMHVILLYKYKVISRMGYGI